MRTRLEVAAICFLMAQPPNLRNAIPFFVLSFFLVYIFSSGVQHEFSSNIPSIFTKGSGPSTRHSTIVPFCLNSALDFPDFGNYRRVATMSAEQLSLGFLVLFLCGKTAC